MAATILVLTSVFAIPEKILESLPNAIIPITYTAAAYGFMYMFQGKNIATHKISEGKFFSWWRVIGIGLIGLVTFLLLGFIFGIIVN